jgi:chemosensory pili system protein ChpA (sensor histidine kinase/response regulator)
MTPEGSGNSAALRWVREDLDDCLRVVRENLEAFAEDRSRRDPLVTVQDALERLNLTFQTMQQQGAGILTDEMIAVGGHMLHNGNADCEDSLNALTDAVIVLPSYLDRLQAGHEDLPILLLPTLNELRATYDEALLSEGTLFAPDLDIIIPELSGSEADAIATNEFAAFARRIRSLYQGALLGWLKEQSRDGLLEPMQQVCRKLYTRLGRNDLRRLWWIADLSMQGLRDGAIDNDLPLRRLFARLDLTLKTMAEAGESGPASETITALSRALLFYAAQARPGSRGTDRLRERFRLEELIPDRDALLRARGAVTGRDAGLFRSIGDAVREELAQVKDTLDMELRTGRIDAEQRSASKTSLRQLADTLQMLELPVPAKAVQDLLPALEETDGVTNMDLDSPLLALAQKLLEVESILATHIQLLGEPVDDTPSQGFISLPPHEQRLVLSSLLDECVASLHEVEDAIRGRLEGDPGADYRSGLVQVAGALEIAGETEVAALSGKLLRALNAALSAGTDGKPGPVGDIEHLEPLTDAVAALELYLASRRDDQTGSRGYLEIMAQRLEGLPEASDSGEAVPATSITLPAATPQPAAAPAAPKKSAAAETATGAPQIDPAMLDIFLDEFDSVHRRLAELAEPWCENGSDERATAEIRRGFHTLKGSGRMVGATEIGDFSWRFEELLNRLIEGNLPFSPELGEIVQLGTGALTGLRARLLGEDGALDDSAIDTLKSAAQRMAGGDRIDLGSLRDSLPTALLSWATGAESAAPATPAPAPPDARKEPAEDVETEVAGVDPTLQHLMAREIRGLLPELEQFCDEHTAGRRPPVSADLVRAVHTLAGTLAMAPLGQEADVARALEYYLENRLNSERPVSPTAAALANTCLHRFCQRLYTLEGGDDRTFPRDDTELVETLNRLPTQEDVAPAAATVEAEPETAVTEAASGKDAVEAVAQEESVDQTAAAATDEDAARDASEDATEDQIAAAAGTADDVTTEPEREIAADAGPLQVEDGSILAIFLEEATEVLERCDGLLNTWRDKLADRKLVQSLQREIHTFKGGARMAGLEGLGTLSHTMETVLEHIAANRIEATVAAVQALEEGCDSLNQFVEQLHAGRMPDSSAAQSRFERKIKALRVPQPAAEPVAEAPPEAAPPTTAKTQKAEAMEAPPAQAETSPAPPQAAEPAQEKEKKKEKEKEPTKKAPPAAAEPAPEARPAAPSRKSAAKRSGKRQEPARVFREIRDRPAAAAEDTGPGAQIRVAADLMDKLVNYAGEVSIYRSRLEQQMGSVRFTLKEVDATVQRLKEQLRKMDMESEAQMMSRYQSASTKGSSEFDPLELDRFSNMQQLSRGLSETVSDLLNLHDMLEESIRQAESLLTQQSRVGADLQEGLMQTRMTPFGAAAPRLRRVVRAAAAETGKKARLQLRMAGSSDQLDRNVLERITAPLEHMLRNAVAHGIEDPKLRRRQDKPEEGEIIVTVEAEATEFVIRVEDDGAGIDVDAVRKRAIERGLLGRDEQAEPQRLMQFIRESGFSTATTVTGLAGRGVGMDVVNNEIKQIGGSMEIDSERGKGTCFTIRIPFSLAVMQAIGVNVGERMFQIPLNCVAGVARLTPAEYSALLRGASPAYEFAGEEYPLIELEPLLEAPTPPLESDSVSLLMIRTGDHLAAFRVAGLQGHREVVVKPVGPQISSIPGILGGTIAADGQVMIILDMGPLIRRGLEQATKPVEPVAAVREESRQPLVMVVDDSITMRKVTSRVLENHSLEVMTAQDGVDAIEKLHDRVPDLMLLDIEMPRMDGYELLEHVRSDARLRHVPVVMITSRSGQKHRKKARQAGANAYLTKPYQEAELVEQVGIMLDIELTPRRAD